MNENDQNVPRRIGYQLMVAGKKQTLPESTRVKILVLCHKSPNCMVQIIIWDQLDFWRFGDSVRIDFVDPKEILAIFWFIWCLATNFLSYIWVNFLNAACWLLNFSHLCRCGEMLTRIDWVCPFHWHDWYSDQFFDSLPCWSRFNFRQRFSHWLCRCGDSSSQVDSVCSFHYFVG